MNASELRTRLKDAFEWVGDQGTRRPGADRSGWTRDSDVLAAVGSALASLAEDEPTLVLGPETSGFVYGPLVAERLGAGFVGVSKRRRDLSDSDRWRTATTPLDHAGRNLELSVRARLIRSSDRVLLVDDWVDTGGQLLALTTLVEESGARYIGAVAIVDGLTDHQVRRRLKLRSLLSIRDL